MRYSDAMSRVRIAVFALLCLLPLCRFAFAADPAPQVVVLPVKGAINPVSAGYLQREIDQANSQKVRLVVIELDTPGGLDSSMRAIVQREEASRVPVVVYVFPEGARAASAGLFVAMGASVAAMAPGTNIGAAHPVGGGGQDIKGHMAQKVENDAAAYIRALALEHGRNATWAEKAVRKSVSLSAPDAFRAHVVDRIAPDLDSLLHQLDGQKVKVAKGRVVLHLRNAVVSTRKMDTFERALYIISDPNVVLILMQLGMLGLFFELTNPGAILPGVVGGICLLVAIFGMGMLPINYVGVALFALAFALFLADLYSPSHGVLTAGGIIAMILGGFMLLSGSTPGVAINRPLVVVIGLVTGLLFASCVALAISAKRRPVKTGKEDLIGRLARTKTPLEPDGQVLLEGERWQARSESGPIDAGSEVVVRRLEGLTLIVARK
ncbi:MAG: nodulation protein NfeD [Cyanobacteria bacterium REEB65]|nr:nodulation protein NfeD [Cyanobacteria bacterium REEB65]